MKPDPVPSALFRRNRSKLMEAMAPGSAMLIRSGEAKIRSGDQYYPYRQNSPSDPGATLCGESPCRGSMTTLEGVFLAVTVVLAVAVLLLRPKQPEVATRARRKIDRRRDLILNPCVLLCCPNRLVRRVLPETQRPVAISHHK